VSGGSSMRARIAGQLVPVRPLTVAGINAVIGYSGAGLAGDAEAIERFLLAAARDAMPDVSDSNILDATPAELEAAVLLAGRHPLTVERARALGAMLPAHPYQA